MKKLVGIAAGFLLLLPVGAKSCEICKIRIECLPNCEVIEYCADAPWLKGYEVCDPTWYGCQASNPCLYALQQFSDDQTLLAEIIKPQNSCTAGRQLPLLPL